MILGEYLSSNYGANTVVDDASSKAIFIRPGDLWFFLALIMSIRLAMVISLEG